MFNNRLGRKGSIFGLNISGWLILLLFTARTKSLLTIGMQLNKKNMEIHFIMFVIVEEYNNIMMNSS